MKRNKSFSWKTGLVAIVCLFVLLGVLAFTFRDRANKGSGVIPSTTVSKNSKVDKNGSQLANTAPDKNTSPATSAPAQAADATPSSTSIVAPSGSFVSNHHPNLAGSPAPSTEASTCTTTPGASCYIKFTKDGVVKTLDSQNTDSSGSTSWNWDIKKAGFTTGTWQVVAVATLNGQTKTTQDAFTLEVQP